MEALIIFKGKETMIKQTECTLRKRTFYYMLNGDLILKKALIDLIYNCNLLKQKMNMQKLYHYFTNFT